MLKSLCIVIFFDLRHIVCHVQISIAHFYNTHTADHEMAIKLEVVGINWLKVKSLFIVIFFRAALHFSVQIIIAHYYKTQTAGGKNKCESCRNQSLVGLKFVDCHFFDLRHILVPCPKHYCSLL
jgi:hypothetical protein